PPLRPRGESGRSRPRTPTAAPQGPVNEHVGQRSATDWSRHRAHRPMRAFAQLGHRKTVVPLPNRTAPQDVQRASDRITDAGANTLYKTLRPFSIFIIRME